jgi:hypothetical protein
MILHGDVKPKEREEVFVPSSPWTHSTHHTYYAPQDLRTAASPQYAHSYPAQHKPFLMKAVLITIHYVLM